MKRFKITHLTSYDFAEKVSLLPHTIRMRPLEDHDLRIVSSKLDIQPSASMRWHRDVEGNSVLVANFNAKVRRLTINSEIVVEQYNLNPLDFIITDYAFNYPFSYLEEERLLLAPYLSEPNTLINDIEKDWISSFYTMGNNIQSLILLQSLNQHIYQHINYTIRQEEGVHSARETLVLGSGSCRDMATLFMHFARLMGFAARFVSGYVHVEALSNQSMSTHAWAEVFIPGAGWKGFDPSTGNMAGSDHISVSVARLPESVTPVSGSYIGSSGSVMNVSVHVFNLK